MGIGRHRRDPLEVAGGDLREPMALLAIRNLILPLSAGDRGGRAPHQHEFIDARHRGAQETETILPAEDLEHRESRSVHGEDISHKAMVGEVAVVELAPPLGVEFAQAVVEVLVLRDAIIEAAIVQGHGDVIVHVEGLACRVSRIDPLAARQPEGSLFGLVARVQDGIVNGIETNHPFVNIRPGVVHAMVVKPEERLLLRRVVSRGIVMIEVVHPLLGYVPAFIVRHVVGLAIALRRRVAVVQVSEKRPVRRPKVLAIKTQRVHVQVVLKANEVGLPIHGVDSGTGKSPVETVNGAGGQGLRARDSRGRNHRQAAAGDGLYLRTGVGMLPHLHPDVVKLRVRQREAGHADTASRPRYTASIRPELVRSRVGNGGAGHARCAWPRSDCVLAARKRTRWKNHVTSERRSPHPPRIGSVWCQRSVRLPVSREHCRWDRQRIGEWVQDKRTGGEDFDWRKAGSNVDVSWRLVYEA